MAEDVMLKEAIEAIRQGQRIRARDLLTRLLRANQNNPEYWLYMSAVVDTNREQVFCLQSALRIDPQNQAALQGLVLLGARAPEGTVTPAAPQRRKWDVEVQEIEELTGFRALAANPVMRIGFFAFLALLVVALIGLGVYVQGVRRQPVAAVIPTNTPGPTPTYTPTVTPLNFTPVTPTAIPTPTGPLPLWMRLDATYTPTLVYVATRHPSNEAFQIAQRAQGRGELDSALSNYAQALQMSPNEADIPYYMGEIYRQQGRYQQAIEQYTRSIEINGAFAPAYLGRALAQQALSAKVDVTDDLDAAVTNDPNYLAAYLARAELRLAQEDLEGAAEDLGRAETLQPDNARVRLLQAQVQIAQGDGAAALESARRANRMDQTLLLSYRVLAQAADLAGEYEEALQAIDVYLTYEQQDPQAWMIKGAGLYHTGQFSDTLRSVNNAIELDRNLVDAYYYRGLAEIELGLGQKAVNDIFYVTQVYPDTYQINIDLSRALLTANRLGDALGQLRRALDKAETDAEQAQAYYYRAQALERAGNLPSAVKDWKALLALPEDSMPAEWRTMAEAHLQATSTPPPPTATITPTATATPAATLTPTGAASPTAPRGSATPSRTPQNTRPPAAGSGSPTPTP
ncbi:MAG: tetratricopeptide repeat protein [Chloroflexota bacterium]